jgi:hypothetical protein
MNPALWAGGGVCGYTVACPRAHRETLGNTLHASRVDFFMLRLSACSEAPCFVRGCSLYKCVIETKNTSFMILLVIKYNSNEPTCKSIYRHLAVCSVFDFETEPFTRFLQKTMQLYP